MSGPILLILRGILAVSLYAFLGFALYLLWQDLRQQSRLVASRRPPAITLLRVSEEEVPVHFNLPVVVIGRELSCDCVLDHSTVSGQHTRLAYRQGQWWVEDLRSTNGTFLNQNPVTFPMVITSGDEIRCGQESLIINIGEST
jgi:pSer/pThr/pTyr-binding forkhead associated (FHA) protein